MSGGNVLHSYEPLSPTGAWLSLWPSPRGDRQNTVNDAGVYLATKSGGLQTASGDTHRISGIRQRHSSRRGHPCCDC